MKKLEIDLDLLLTQALQHMCEPNDVRWSIGMALEELYGDEGIRDLQSRMEEAFGSGHHVPN